MPGGSPYLTAQSLQVAPAGLAWQVVPTLSAPSAENLAQLVTVCQTATSQADAYCRQPLRATIATEQLRGPGHPRVSIDPDTGEAGLITRRWPVTAVQAVQVSPSRCYPPDWTLVTAGQYRVRNPPPVDAGPAITSGPYGGNAVDVAPDWITRHQGRGYWNILLSYSAGWPHAGLTADASATDTVLTVDDVTGWDGWTGFIYDGQFTEAAAVTAVSATSPVPLPGIAGTVQSGPGTLTLSGPLAYGHSAGTVFSAIPLAALHGVALLAAVQALETIDAIAVQSMNGQSASLGALAESAELALDPFRRIA